MFGFIKKLFGFGTTETVAPTVSEAPYKVEVQPVADLADIAIAQRPAPVAKPVEAKPAAKPAAKKAPAKKAGGPKPAVKPAQKTGGQKPKGGRKPKAARPAAK